MKKGMVLGLAMTLMILGAAAVSSAQSGPVLEKIWAPAELNAGSILRIYIKASDPDGNLRWVIVSGARGGQKAEPTGAVPIRVTKEFRKDMNGYVYWDTKQASVTNTEGKIWIQLEDWKGNESDTKFVVIRLVPTGAKEERPPAEFKNVEIGPIMVHTLQPIGP